MEQLDPITPPLSPDPDQAWFWTAEWQEGEREADADIAAGRTVRFESDEEFLAHLEESIPPAES